MPQFDNQQLDYIRELITRSIHQYQGSRQLSLSLAEMRALGDLIEQQAQQQGVDVVFSVVDSAGIQKYYFAMPNALLMSHELAFKKAYSAVALRIPTLDLAAATESHQPLSGLRNDPQLCCVGGGYPCWIAQKVVAGIGVSGGTVEQDCAIALAALTHFSEQGCSLFKRS